MKNLLNAGQVQLGNIIFANNYKGEEVVRRVVGGAYGDVTKFFLIAENGKLKSRKRDTLEEVLENFEITAIVAPQLNGAVIGGVSLDLEDAAVGSMLLVEINGEIVYRQLVGGYAYGEDIYFTIDPVTGKRTSRTQQSVSEVLEGYLTEEGVSKVKAVVKQ